MGKDHLNLPFVPITSAQACRTQQLTTVLGCSPINSNGDHSNTSPQDLPTGLHRNIWYIGKTPFNQLVLNNYLVNIPNKTIANKLLSGYSLRFCLHYSGPRLHIESSNLISAHQHPRETMEKIANEIKLGRIWGPYEKLPISNLRVSPIGVVPKGDNAGWRLITHLSFPTGNSINEFINPAESTVHYSSFDSVVQM